MTAVATRAAVELLSFEPQSQRARAWFAALTKAAGAAGIDLSCTAKYTGKAPWMALWGPGAPERLATLGRHVAAGGRAICFDLAYWQRDVKVRVSIDAAHPQDWVLRKDWPSSRLVADAVPIADRWNPKGPIVVAGIGKKARAQYGDPVLAWEARMIAACQHRWKRPVIYRKKHSDAPVPDGAHVAGAGDIDKALSGASLVITWHSNVAVDAIRLGIPAICRDGAAAAVCATELGEADPAPLAPDVRNRFLSNLAWFQWTHAEADGCWRFLLELLS